MLALQVVFGYNVISGKNRTISGPIFKYFVTVDKCASLMLSGPCNVMLYLDLLH